MIGLGRFVVLVVVVIVAAILIGNLATTGRAF